jgi:hypothetical protein
MKIMNIFNKKSFVALAACLAMVFVVRAGDAPTANPFLSILSTVPQAELPIKAADLVAHADAKNQSQTTINVVKAAVGLNTAAAPAIVGSIAQATPEMAATAASVACALVPNQAAVIVRAAAAAAPKQAGKIVEAVCRVLPKEYQDIASAVAEVVPGAAKEILAGISTAIPALKEPISKVVAGYSGSVPSVAAVLNQVAKIDLTTAVVNGPQPMVSASPAITVTPPFVTPASSPVNIYPGSGGQAPGGGRGYANPGH